MTSDLSLVGAIFSCVENNPGLLCFCFTSLCDWSKKLEPFSQPIRCKTKTNHYLVARVFPHSGKFGRFYFGFSALSLKDTCLSSDWLLWLPWFWYTRFNQRRLYSDVVDLRSPLKREVPISNTLKRVLNSFILRLLKKVSHQVSYPSATPNSSVSESECNHVAKSFSSEGLDLF